MAFQLLSEFPDNTRNNTCSACLCSRRPSDRIIDPFISIDFEGNLMLCETCVKEMAALIGWIDAETAERMRHEISGRNDYIKQLEKKLGAKEDFTDALKHMNEWVLEGELGEQPDLAPITKKTSARA